MNALDFLPHLGKSDEDTDLQLFLKQLGATHPPRRKSGDIDARVSLNDLGIDVVFAPVEGDRGSRLVVRSVLFYGNTQGGLYTPYAGTLPFDLHFTDSRAEAQRKAGLPSFSTKRLASDGWDFRTYAVHVRYPSTHDRISRVSLSADVAPENERMPGDA